MTRTRPTQGRCIPFGPIGAAALAAVLAAPSLLASPQSSQSSRSSESASDRVEAKDSARDSQQSSHQDSQTSSHTRRVVVKDGRTVVDEETRDGKPTRGGAQKAPAARGKIAPRGAGAAGAVDPQAEVQRMMREIEEQMQREMPRAMVEALREARANGGAGRAPTGRGQAAPRGARPGAKGAIDPQAEVDRMMREMEAQMRRELGKLPGGANVRGGAGGPVVDRQSSKSSHTRRVVVKNGETVVDEDVRDGVPVPNRGGVSKTPKAGGGDAQLEIQQIMRDFEAERARQRRTTRGARPDAAKPKPTGAQPLRPVRGATPPMRPRPVRSAPAGKRSVKKSPAPKVTGGR